MSREDKKEDTLDRLKSCDILGVNVAITNMDETVEWLCANVRRSSGRYICVSNVHTTVMSYDDRQYREIQNKAVAVLPDGAPLSAVQRRKGWKGADRVAGPDLMKEIFLVSAEKGFRHYFYGSTEKTLQKLKEALRSMYPEISIVGMYAPPFRPMNSEEDKQIVEQINSAKADFVWVGLGAPKQERWMAEHEYKVQGVMIGVGAGFDYCAGNLRRAPYWMQKVGLEWSYRLLQEPKRLLKRYMVTNVKFLWLLFWAKRGQNNKES